MSDFLETLAQSGSLRLIEKKESKIGQIQKIIGPNNSDTFVVFIKALEV